MGPLEQAREAAHEALPPVEGEVAVAGLGRPVEVIRDRWGVPHVYAESLEDVFLAQGFIQASERLFQIDMVLRTANGRLATIFSELALPLDRFARTVGWHVAGRRIAAGYDDLSRTMASSFRAGVRAWLKVMPAPPVEYRVLELEPDLPDDDGYWAAAGVLLAWGLSGNWDQELLRAEIVDRLGWEAMLDLFPDLPAEAPPAIAGKAPSGLELMKAAPPRRAGRGSNNWVVAGSRTASGAPLLANDPHLEAMMPSIWFEAHLSAPGYEASGVALPFAPGVVIGRTAHHAWGFTNVGGDTQDLYLELLSEDGTAARYEDAWEPLQLRREEIVVRGRKTQVLEVRETRHGPILDSYAIGIAHPEIVEDGIGQTYALRWVGAEHGIQPSTLVRMARADGFPAFREAVRDWGAPGQNMVYADVDGSIGYQCTGLYPVRGNGDGTVPVPGWASHNEWDGFVPFDELPAEMNPETGFLATANDKIHDDSYPHLIGRDFLPPARVRRIVELLTGTEKHSRDTFAAIQADTVSLPARELVGYLLTIEPATERQREALTELAGWDGDLAAESAAAAVYEVWCKHVAEQVLRRALGEELFQHYYGRTQSVGSWKAQVLPNLLANATARWFGIDGGPARDDLLRRALEGAVAELDERLGEDVSAWRWGALHRAVFAGPLAIVPDLAPLFTGGVLETGGDDDTVNQSGFEPGASYEVAVLASWRQIVDLSDPDASVGVHTTGQSGNPASPHWNDLVPLWSRGEYHPLPFTRAAVQANAETAMTLAPR